MTDWYVDFGAANDGDGTAYGQAAGGGAVGAWNTLAGKTPAVGDRVWLRRVAKAMTTTALTLPANRAIYIGWPTANDAYYATRPDGGARAAWDGDAGTYAEIDWTTGAGATLPATANGSYFYRMKFKTTTTGTTVFVAAGGGYFYNCVLECASNSTTAGKVLNITGAYYSRFDACTLTVTGTGASGADIQTTTGIFDLEFVNCTITDTVSTYGGSLVYMQNTGTSYFIGCTISTLTAGLAAPRNLYSMNVANVMFLQDCTVDTDKTGNSVSICVGDVTANTTSRLVAFNLTMNKVRTIQLSGGCYVHFRKFAQVQLGADYEPAYAIQVATPGTIVCGNNFSFATGAGAPAGTRKNTISDVQTGNGIYYFLQNCTFQKLAAIADAPGIWTADDGGTAGQIAFRGDGATITAPTVMSNTAVVRTGGEAFSLRLFLNATLPWKQCIPFVPPFETIYVSLTAGAHTITLFGAYDLLYAVPPTQKDLWFETDYYADAAGARRAFASTRTVATTALTADVVSAWSDDVPDAGDRPRVKFSLALTITVGQACLCPIRIYQTAKDAAKYVYIDPKPVVS